MSKRVPWILLVLLVAVSMLLSACGAQATQTPAAKQQVEVFSWWTGGGEAAGLEAILSITPPILFIRTL